MNLELLLELLILKTEINYRGGNFEESNAIT